VNYRDFEYARLELPLLHRCRPEGVAQAAGRLGLVSSQIRKQLDTVVSPKSKLTKPVRKPKAVWVEPSFTAEIEYRDITSEGCFGRARSRGS
jgi:ATP-dependent DNA ligase